MRYFDAFTGIASATHAFHRLGWECAGFSEIDKFPSAVLAHRYPGVKNYGDITKYREWNRNELGPIDAICGGSPCQAFSVAGLGQGISDPRGELMLTYGALAAYLRPARVIWENVPGVLSSNGGRDFASFLALLTGRAVSVPSSGWKNSGIVGGIPEAYGIAWTSLDAQYFGVPQRRERIFVVGYLGDWRRAAAVLFESESLLGYSPPSREAGQNTAGTLASRTSGGGGLGTDFDLAGGLQEVDLYENHPQDSRVVGPLETAGTVSAKYGTGGGDTPLVAGTLQSGGKAAGSATQQDAEAGLLLIAETLRGHPRPGSNSLGALTYVDDVAPTLTAGPNSKASHGKKSGTDRETLVAMTLNAKGGSGRMDGESETLLPTVFSIMPMNSGKDYKARIVEVSQPVLASGPGQGNQGGDVVVAPLRTKPYADNASHESQLVVDDVTHTLRGEEFDASEDGTGRGTPLTVAFSSKDNGRDATDDLSPTLRSMGHAKSHQNGGGQVAVATFDPTQITSKDNRSSVEPNTPAGTVHGDSRQAVIGVGVRRLMPIECERLQGLPDNWTLINNYNGKWAKDGPRYKAIGNSMAEPVMFWIGSNIERVDKELQNDH